MAKQKHPKLSVQLLHNVLMLIHQEPGPVLAAYQAVMEGESPEVKEAHAQVMIAWLKMGKIEYGWTGPTEPADEWELPV